MNSRILRVSLPFLILAGIAVAQNNPTTQKAKEIWERALKAKGGRERLQSVDSFLMSERYDAKKPPAVLRLDVFPDRYWLWDDDRPSVLGLRIEAASLSGAWNSFDGGNHTGRGTSWGEGRSAVLRPHYDEALFLLETRWFHPIPLSASIEAIGKETFDVVVVNVDADPAEKLKYYVDQKTSLIRRVATLTGSYSSVFGAPYYDLTNYRLIDGINLPMSMHTHGSGSDLLEFQINVHYDSAAFSRPPEVEAGLEGWKPRTLWARSSKDTKTLIDELEHKDDDIAFAAHRELILRGKDMIPIIAEALKQKRGCRFQFAAARVLSEFESAKETVSATIVNLAKGKCEGDSAKDYFRRRESLELIISQPAGISVASELLRSRDARTRWTAANTLYQLAERMHQMGPGHAAATPEILDALKRAILQLMEGLKDRNKNVRCDSFTAISAFAKVQDRDLHEKFFEPPDLSESPCTL